jgi:hypothetical protein
MQRHSPDVDCAAALVTFFPAWMFAATARKNNAGSTSDWPDAEAAAAGIATSADSVVSAAAAVVAAASTCAERAAVSAQHVTKLRWKKQDGTKSQRCKVRGAYLRRRSMQQLRYGQMRRI